jgi:hypothetical protein
MFTLIILCFLFIQTLALKEKYIDVPCRLDSSYINIFSPWKATLGNPQQNLKFKLNFEFSGLVVLDEHCGKKFGFTCPKYCNESKFKLIST